MQNFNELLDLSGKTAIITGGSRGIGFGITYRLAEAGANVVIAALDQKEMDKAVKELSAKGWRAKAVKGDVS